MPQKDNHPEDTGGMDPDMSSLMQSFGRGLRDGSIEMPSPTGRAEGPDEIFKAFEAARGSEEAGESVNPRLVEIVRQADVRVPRLRFIRLWLPAAAAALAFAVGLALWYPRDSLRGPHGMDLDVGYSDLGGADRGSVSLRPGTTARVYVTVAEKGFLALLLYNHQRTLTIEQSPELVEPGRLEIEWMIPEDAISGARETLFAVFSPDAFSAGDEVIKSIKGACASSRAECLAAFDKEIRRSGEFRIEHVTYRIGP